MNPSHPSEPNQASPPDDVSSEELLSSLTDVGLAWARYGLTVGRVALETHAKTVTLTAGALGALAGALTRTPSAPTASRDVVDSTKPLNAR